MTCFIFAFFQGQIFKMLNFILPCNHVICVRVQRCCELCLGVLVTRVREVLVQWQELGRPCSVCLMGVATAGILWVVMLCKYLSSRVQSWLAATTSVVSMHATYTHTHTHTHMGVATAGILWVVHKCDALQGFCQLSPIMARCNDLSCVQVWWPAVTLGVVSKCDDLQWLWELYPGVMTCSDWELCPGVMTCSNLGSCVQIWLAARI